MTGTPYYGCENQHESLEAVFKKTIAFTGDEPYLRIPSSFPFQSDLVFDFDTRTDLDLVDNIAGELGAINNFTVGNFSGAEWIDFAQGGDYNNTSFSFGCFANLSNVAAGAQRFIQKRGTGPLGNPGWILRIDGAANFEVILESTAPLQVSLQTVGVAANNTNYFIVGQFNTTTGRIDLSVYNITTGVLVETVNVVNAGLIGGNFTTARRLAIGAAWDAVAVQSQFIEGDIWGGWSVNRLLTVAELTSLSTGAIPQSLKNSIAGNAQNKICLDVYSGIDSSGNNFHGTVNGVDKGYSTFNRELFDNGFQQYWDQATGLVSLQVPYNVAGNPINPGDPYTHDGNAYDFSENHPYNVFHNLAECFVNMNPTGSALAKFNIFNRSLAAVFNATARVALPVGTYNAAAPWTFHIHDFSQFVLAGFYQVGERRKTYTQGTDQSIRQDARFNLDRIFVYATDKLNNDDIRVLEFTNDIVQVVTDAGGNYIFDANGYAVLINT